MQKLLAITWKELYTTFRARNLLLIMFVTPIMLSTIMGLAFGGLGGDDGPSVFQDIPIAVVNLDEGFNLAEALATGEDGLDEVPSLDELEIEIGGETINVGEQLLLNANLSITNADLGANNASFRYGDLLAGILLSETVTATNSTTATPGATTTNNVSFDNLTCPLLEDEVNTPDGEEIDDDESDTPFGFEGTLGDLFDAVRLGAADAARASVEQGDYVAAVIIPPDFTQQTLPTFDIVGADESDGEPEETGTVSAALTDTVRAPGAVEIYANGGQAISASIVRAVVEGIINQLVRTSVALDAVANATVVTIQDNLSIDSLGDLDLSTINPQLITRTLQSFDASVFEPLACLILPNTGNIQLERQPLDELQTRSAFAAIMITLGAAQAIFFAMFTGIFGINSIYEERDNWTLQRIIASPTPRVWILGGKLLGNVTVVTAQLAILFLSLTVITSLVEGELTFIWGTNIPALLAAVAGISLFTSGLGVLVVGIAKNTQQVQFFGPMVATVFGAVGGSFGFQLPPEVAGISPIWWGIQALVRISNGETGELGIPLLVLFGCAVVTFVVGLVLFRRRLDL